MQIRYDPLAQKELFDTIQYYEDQSIGLGDDFFNYYLLTLDIIIENPKIYAVIDKKNQIRRGLVERFTYAIFYTVNNKTIEIYAISHQKREPNYWYSRLQV